jgi:hypothetical protein
MIRYFNILFFNYNYMRHKIGRDAKTWRFITVKEAQKRPKTTVVETIRKK